MPYRRANEAVVVQNYGVPKFGVFTCFGGKTHSTSGQHNFCQLRYHMLAVTVIESPGCKLSIAVSAITQGRRGNKL